MDNESVLILYRAGMDYSKTKLHGWYFIKLQNNAMGQVKL